MSSEIAIKVDRLSKCYQIYDQPSDRLKQMIFPRSQRVFGRLPNQYYREFWALKDVSFEVKKGEAVGIIGRNGSGKSTLLQIITGTLAESSGSVQTNGRIAALLELGSGFNPDFSGRENVYLNGILLGLTRHQIDVKFDAIAAFADIGEHLEQPVKTYSSGMLVRLAFAVQVQVDPDILIVDEALAVGDWLFQKRCFQRIERLVSNGTTLLFVSHDQESVRTLTNRALFLNRGTSQAWGISSDVVLEYRRFLHEEEEAHLSVATRNLIDRSRGDEALVLLSPAGEPEKVLIDSEISPDKVTANLRSEQLSFGDGGVKVLKVEILDATGTDCTVFYPRDKINIRITCRSLIETDKLNVAIRIRNKEGVKIYSWGTLNQDMAHHKSQKQAVLFWNKMFAVGEIFAVELSFDCTLGVNIYEVQASVSYEETADYMSQRILHWIDEAAFFQVSMKKDEYFFGGAVDLRMQASW